MKEKEKDEAIIDMLADLFARDFAEIDKDERYTPEQREAIKKQLLGED